MSPFPNTLEGFTPAMLELLDRTFSATWRELQLRKSTSVSTENEQATRTAITKSITDLAAAGVREPQRLKRHALHAAEQARSRRRLPN